MSGYVAHTCLDYILGSLSFPNPNQPIIYTPQNILSSPLLPAHSASLAVEVPEDNDDLDFFYGPVGTIVCEELEEDFLECFLVQAHACQHVHFLWPTILTTIDTGLSPLPTTGRARLLDMVNTNLITLNTFVARSGVGGNDAPTVFGPQAPSLYP